MSHIGNRSALQTIKPECLHCKRYKNTEKDSRFFGEYKVSGHCTLGYCEKKNFKKR